MKKKIATLAIAAGLGFLGLLSGNARADEWDQKTIFTFSTPVEIPGQVLPAGTYVFKLADSQSDRNIVQVFSKDGRHLYGTFLAVSDQRLRPAGKPIITFDERPSDSPEAVKAWFYPGETFGHEFVYPKPKAAALAKVNHAPVPSMPAELTPNTTQPEAPMTAPHVLALKETPLKAQMPTEEEVEIAEIITAPDPVPPMSQTLPSTGSALPLIALAGAAFFGIAGLIQVVKLRAGA